MASYQPNQFMDLRAYTPTHLGLVYPVPAEASDENADEDIDVSIVIPVFNEEESLEALHTQVAAVLDSMEQTSEIILVDDGSTDNSFAVLKRLSEQDPRVRVIQFRRNFGQTAAFSAGFDVARGAVIVTMDADLQNDPADIPRLLEVMDSGYDVVSGWRIKRQDALLIRKIPSRIANRLISRMTGVYLHDYGCSLKAYRREVVQNIRLYGELHRFIPALASWMGIRIAELPVNHSARQFGRSKYGLKRIVKVLLDLITVKFLLDYATRPIQIFGLFGLVCAAAGVALAAYLSTLRLFFGEPLSDRPLLLLAIMLIVLGAQLISMGLLGELIVRTYYETRGKPTYMVREVLGQQRKRETPDKPRTDRASAA